MPRGKTLDRLQADIQSARHETIPHIQKIGKGNEQEEFFFTFTHPQIPQGEIEICVMLQDMSGYPRDNSFFVYTNESVPPRIGQILEGAMMSTTGMRIADMLKSLSHQLSNSLEFSDGNESVGTMIGTSDPDVNSPEASDGSDTDLPFDYYDDDDDFEPSATLQHPASMKPPDDNILQRIRQDFRTVQKAGFRVGKICGMESSSDNSIMTISIKARKLGLSEKTRLAWDLEPSDYVVLLMKYPREYISFEDAITIPASQIPLSFRLRKCSKYRPTLKEAITAFSATVPKGRLGESEQKTGNYEDSSTNGVKGLSTFVVGGSIDLLLDSEFFAMMKLRKMRNVSWDDAKRIHSVATKSNWNSESITIPTSPPESTELNDLSLPAVLTKDHLVSKGPVSLPLVAMQFALRYLIKCTDYCMICHDKIAGNFAALKPYVCGNPLCLWQYMSIGLGPSIDHEIINHERVVDLLVSFCYASLHCSLGKPPKIREFPIGLNLQVPCIRKSVFNRNQRDVTISKSYGTLVDPLKVELSWHNSKAIITDKPDIAPPGLMVGQWVVIHTEHNSENTPEKPRLNILHYARIEEKNGLDFQLYIASRHPVPMTLAEYERLKLWNWEKTGLTAGQLVLCNQPLDDIGNDEEKAFSLTLLLSTLPSVEEMRSYLTGNQSRQLATWNRIPPSAMKLLRWIIASNRSFIVQVDDSPSNGANSGEANSKRPYQSEARISGLDGWIQFRFAQGSPEKEALFFDSLAEVESPHRTILAWHGSSVGNWHSIIRDGLDFKVVTNGRSYGHGVYFSRSFDYSVAYSGRSHLGGILDSEIESFWPQSSLQITQAISLNELVNLPHKFKHSASCYVVDILHWIQCRYLFVRPKQDEFAAVEVQKTRHTEPEEFEQDPEYAIIGPNNKKIFVPKIAIPSVQQWQHQAHSSPTKPSQAESDDTDDEDNDDVKFLDSEDSIPTTETGVQIHQSYQETQIDFRPGSLDFSKLPQLAPPSYATKPAQQTIQRELHKLNQVQSTTPLHELGWYIDFDKIENMFQWIVELHSFDPSLLLAQDMKAAGIPSIVLEIRFLRGFPMSPPFIRVIQPKFLPFMMGGGGHVTGGGALCMELLTNTGWSPVNSMESVLLQVRLAICSLDPKPARLAGVTSRATQYSIREAVEAYSRAAARHGWEIPADLKEATME
ncbi:hypothetical protein F4825DRAFT_459864 [Nemania diffusa]|nr:hypothetical protein F4825DRAFT_459864 [Nemania diffusa]